MTLAARDSALLLALAFGSAMAADNCTISDFPIDFRSAQFPNSEPEVRDDFQ